MELKNISEECNKLKDYLDEEEMKLYVFVRSRGQDKKDSLRIALRGYVTMRELGGVSSLYGYACHGSYSDEFLKVNENDN